MNHICTWLCADEKGEESIFPQTGRQSSSQSHQNIYWRCLVVFFITSRRFNINEKHILFTNVKILPVIEGKDIQQVLNDLKVEVIYTDFKYKTPKGYFGMFQNQFYEFSILEYIVSNNPQLKDHYLVLDSDCIFIKPVHDLFLTAEPKGFISFQDDVHPDYVINQLSRNDMKHIFEELLKHPLDEAPPYHLGEFLLSSVENIRKIFYDFQELWQSLLIRNYLGMPKFNEEAHTLSFLYYKNGLHPEKHNRFMKRIWTNPLFYRNVSASDTELAIWHLPSEKTFGLYRLYDLFINRVPFYGTNFNTEEYNEVVQKTLGIPVLPLGMKIRYYVLSYYRAFVKRIRNLKVVHRPEFG